MRFRQSVFVWALALFCFHSGVHAGLIMESMVFPDKESDVWRLASAGADRYTGGWYSPGTAIDDGTHTTAAPVILSPLRLRHISLASIPHTAALWRSARAGTLPVEEQILFSWVLRIPAYPSGPIALVLRERMLLVPREVRIELAPLEVEPQEE